ncbi:MAG: hypothetical protein MJ185_02735 [Treponema sp.]|nr:hypothetical protein [Treponema sp.]
MSVWIIGCIVVAILVQVIVRRIWFKRFQNLANDLKAKFQKDLDEI